MLRSLFRKPRKQDLKAHLNVELLEDRLTPSWTGVPPATIVPPSTALAVTLNSAGDAGGAAAITSNEVDYYRFTATTSGTYVFTASRSNSSIDTVLGVFNSGGSRLGYNDDISSTNLNSRLTLSLTAGNTYYVGITNYTGAPGGNYTWFIDGPTADDRYEENDTQATATNLGTSTSRQVLSNLVMADSADWFRFTTSGTGTSSSYVAISFTHAQGDLDMELVNSSGAVLARSNGVTNSESISLNGLAAGTYYVRVYGYNGARNPNYTLDVSPPAASAPAPTPTGSFSITLRISGMTASQETIFRQAAARWQQAIVGDLPDMVYNGVAVDDVLIDASARSIDGVNGILGQAGPDAFRSGTYLPYHGSMQFDSADLASLEASGQLQSVIIHEMGHVLGIGTIWSARGLLSGAGTADPRFRGTQATAEYNRLFGRNESGVPVENSGGAGTRDSHWRESVFGNELMTGYLNSGFNPLSRMTIASLADLGYQVNLAAADPYTPPAALTSTSTTTSTSRSAGLRSSLVMFDTDGFVNMPTGRATAAQAGEAVSDDVWASLALPHDGSVSVPSAPGRSFSESRPTSHDEADTASRDSRRGAEMHSSELFDLVFSGVQHQDESADIDWAQVG